MTRPYVLGITGSRSITSMKVVGAALTRYIEQRGWPSRLVEGEANGVDKLAAKCCEAWGIEVERCPAAWRDENGVFNRAAGMERNAAMARKIDALLAIWDGHSKGTRHMIDYCRARGLDVRIEIVD